MENSITGEQDSEEKSNLQKAIKIESSLLGDSFWLVPDEKARKVLLSDPDLLFERLTIYSINEAKALLGTSEEHKKMVHTVKKEICGTEGRILETKTEEEEPF